MEMIKKILGIRKYIFHYKKPDPAKRKISDKHGTGGPNGNHTVTNRSGLYNQNLTVGELSILRSFIWEYKEVCKDSWEYHRFLNYIHSWMFTDKKEPVLYRDILQDVEEGINFEERPL